MIMNVYLRIIMGLFELRRFLCPTNYADFYGLCGYSAVKGIVYECLCLGIKFKCEAIPEAAKKGEKPPDPRRKPPNPQRGNTGLTIDELTN
jgi:hypothetical protein